MQNPHTTPFDAVQSPAAMDAGFLARLLDALPELVFAKDLEGRYLHVNRAFAEALGRGPDAIVGTRDQDLLPPADAARERATDETCLRSRAPLTTADGSRGLLRGADGRPIGVGGTARPSGVPASTHPVGPASPEESVADEGRLEELLDALPVAVYMKNADGTYSGANAAFARLLGAPDPGTVAGRRDTDFAWRALDHPRIDEEVVQSGLARHGVQRREVDRFARRRWTETSVVPRTDHLGRVTGVVGIRLDVSAHRAELAQSERARVAAERASRSKSRFLTQMSHELRTPLTSLLGFAELALEGETDPEARLAHLERIRDNGWQVLALVDDLLDLSRIESGRLATRARVFCPREIIEGLVATYEPRLRALGLDLHVEIDDAVPAAVTSDPIRFRQIVANLLDRARREAGAGTVSLRATVSGRDEDAILLVEIRDEGPTLVAEELDRQLHPFDREDEAETGRGGLGLGLAVAWNLAELLEGRIDYAAGTDGRGTRFTLRLPIRGPVADESIDWSPATRAAHDPWQRVEAAARDGVAWFAPPPDDVESDEEDAGSATASASAPAPAPTPPTGSAGLHPTPAGSSAEAAETAPRCRILLAEDTADTARFLMLVLRSRGHHVEHAADGEAALELHERALARGEPFDMVLTDVQMPRMDGLALTRRLRSAGWTGPVIALTAHASAEHRRDAVAAGCDDHVAKPLTPAGLQALVARHAGGVRRNAA